MDQLVDILLLRWGLDTAEVLALMAVLSLACRLIGKAIPDDKTGWLGAVRKITKVVGLYTSNRVTRGVSVTDVSKAILDSKVDGPRSQTVETVARKIHSPMLVSLIAMMLMFVMLAGCTMSQIGSVVCNNIGLAQAELDKAVESKNRERALKLLNFMQTTCPVMMMYLDYTEAKSAGVVK